MYDTFIHDSYISHLIIQISNVILDLNSNKKVGLGHGHGSGQKCLKLICAKNTNGITAMFSINTINSLGHLWKLESVFFEQILLKDEIPAHFVKFLSSKLLTLNLTFGETVSILQVLNYCPKDMKADICVHLNRKVIDWTSERGGYPIHVKKKKQLAYI